jgi:hypothetical protein
MAKTGETDCQALYLETDAGVAATYADKTAFLAAGYALTFRDIANAALSPQPTWTIPTTGVGKRHLISFTVPDGVFTCGVTLPSGKTCSPVEFSGEGTAYDVDSVGGLIVSSNGVTVTPTRTDSTASMFDGDSIDLSFSVTEAALTSIGATSLADCTTRAAEIKLDTLDSSAAASVATLVETITTDTSGTRIIRATLDTFPSALAVAASTKSTSATAHLRLTKSTKTIIAAEIKLTINWKATT